MFAASAFSSQTNICCTQIVDDVAFDYQMNIDIFLNWSTPAVMAALCVILNSKRINKKRGRGRRKNIIFR
jgi:hypothetical protein